MSSPVDPSRAFGVSPAGVAAGTRQVAAVRRDGPEAGHAFGPPLKAGDLGILGPYRVVGLLRSGGMGAVYVAIDTRLDRQVALKVMHAEVAADLSCRERFLREARAAAQISHDHVVTVYEADERGGVPYIAMQLLVGCALDEYLEKEGRLSLPQILRIARETATGLAVAHRIGLVHRDLKPGNLWLEAPDGRVKLLDFGLAKPMNTDVNLTRSGEVMGTPAYMSPEQARGEKVDHRSDLFSLGALLYRLCTGRLPFEGPTVMAVLTVLATEEPRPLQELNPDVPEALAGLICQLLAKNPAERLQSAEEVANSLDQINVAISPRPGSSSATLRVPAPPVAKGFAVPDTTEAEQSSPEPARKKPGHGRARVAAGITGILAVVAVAALILKTRDGAETKSDGSQRRTLTTQDKDRKTPTGAGVETKPQAADPDADRKAAEWALSIGGVVRINDETGDIKVVTALPQGRFRVTWADLTKKAVTDTGLVHLKGLQGLKELHVAATPVTDDGLENFKGLTRLTILNLDNTRVTGPGLAYLQGLTGLQRLSLAHTTVSDAGLANLQGLTGLAWLNLRGTKVSAKGLAEFQAAVPGCHIGHNSGSVAPKK